MSVATRELCCGWCGNVRNEDNPIGNHDLCPGEDHCFCAKVGHSSAPGVLRYQAAYNGLTVDEVEQRWEEYGVEPEDQAEEAEEEEWEAL